MVLKKFLSNKIRWILLPVCVSFLTGCWDRVEINELAIALGAALDEGPNHQILFSEQVAIPVNSSGQSTAGVTSASSQLYSATGKDLHDAMQRIQLKISRKLFIAHRRVFLVSEKMARKGFIKELDEVTRNPQSRMRTNIVVTEGKAYSFLQKTYPFERTSAEGLRKIINNPKMVESFDMKDLVVESSTVGEDIAIPMVSEEATSPGAASSFKFSGYAIFKSYEMVGKLSVREARLMMWMRNKVSHSIVTFKLPGYKGYISSSLLRLKVDYKSKMKNGHPEMVMIFKPEDDIVENQTVLDLNDPKNVNLVEKAYSDYIKKLLQELLIDLQKKYHSDTIGIGEQIHREYPKEWKGLSQNWEDEFSNMKIEIQVEGKVRRIGMTGPTLGLEPQEVKY